MTSTDLCKFTSARARKAIHAIVTSLKICMALPAILVATPAAAQSCRTADANSAFMIADLRKLVSSTDPQDAYQRRDLAIPVVDTSTIVLVTQTQTCAKALTAFLTTLPTGYPTPLPSNVYVVKVGSVYVAMHPPPAGETGSPYAVLDSKYKVLAKYSL
jgi:hypothetical protein